jgi:hypothetical protein
MCGLNDDVVVDLRMGVWDFTLGVVCLILDPVLVLAREVTLASERSSSEVEVGFDILNLLRRLPFYLLRPVPPPRLRWSR